MLEQDDNASRSRSISSSRKRYTIHDRLDGNPFRIDLRVLFVLFVIRTPIITQTYTFSMDARSFPGDGHKKNNNKKRKQSKEREREETIIHPKRWRQNQIRLE